jgi:polysaccharide export outer membrane protein
VSTRALALAFAGVLACSSPPRTLEPPRPAAADGQEPSYVVRSGDVLAIRIWPETQLGGEFPVEESGAVHLPFLGEVRAGDRSLDSLRAELRARYAQALKTPVVSVTPLFRVSVLGAVVRPGLYRIDPTQTLFDVVSQAGGFRPDANPDRLRVVRAGQVMELNARQALRTGETFGALALQSGDRIVVPEKGRALSLQNVFYVLQSAVMVATLIELSRR